jgi:hypothetical protein
VGEVRRLQRRIFKFAAIGTRQYFFKLSVAISPCYCETWVSLQTTSGVVAGKRPRSAHAEANIDKRVDYFEVFKEALSKMVQVSSDAAVK